MDSKHASTPPVTLYKYCPPERIDILEGLTIRFSPPSEFNDHFDSHFLVPKDQGSKAKVARSRLKSKLGVFCMTEHVNNRLMWVNYARNHTGFVIGFDARAAFFGEEDRKLRKVDYRDTPPVLLDANVDACFIKSTDWTGEAEWRCARVFESSESRIVNIEPSLVTHVIFGFRMEDWRIAKIAPYTEIYEQASFFRSIPSRSGFAFENQPKKVAACEHCGGNGYTMTDLE